MVDVKKVGNIISVCRREKGFTQDELSARLAVTPQAISRWERGNSLPDIAFLPDISRLLDISIDNLLMGNLPAEEADEAEEIKSNSIQPIPDNALINTLLPDDIEILISIENFKENQEKATAMVDLLIDGIRELRSSLTKEIGIITPVVRIRDDMSIPKDRYNISFRKRLVHTDVITCEQNGSDLIVSNLKRLIIENPELIVTRQMVKAIVDNMSIKSPVLAEEMIPTRINYGKLRLILIGLIKKGKPINDIVMILELIDELMGSSLDSNKDIGELTELISERLN